MRALSVLILATNEAEDLPGCLRSLQGLDGEAVVLDGGSSDATAQIARDFGANVFRRPFDNFAHQRVYGLSQIKTPWVLSLDSDERLTPELIKEINQVVQSPKFDGYAIPFQVEFMGRLMRFNGLGGEKHLRLFKKDRVSLVDDHSVHEIYELHPTTSLDQKPLSLLWKLTTPERWWGQSRLQGVLSAKIIHRPYRDLVEYLGKCDFYADLYAKDFIRAKKKLTWRYRLVVPYEFLRCYLLNLGFLDGFPGLLWAGLSAYHRKARLAKIRRLLNV